MAAPSTYGAAIQLFRKELVENLFNDNAFLMQSRDWSASAIGKTVNWNKAGAKPGVKFNSTTGHGTAASRADVLESFNLDEIITAPTLLDWTNEIVVNYELRNSILRDHRLAAGDQAALRMLYNWAPTLAANIVRTTGAAKTAAAPSATGTRKKITLADILNARLVLNKQNVDLNNRVMVIPADMEADMLAIDNFISVDYKANKPLETGLIGYILGMPVYVHASSIVYDNAATPAPIQPLADDTFTPYAGAVADNQSAFIWHRDYVVRAISNSSLVSMIDVHGGVEFSTTSILGGSRFYKTSQTGIVAIVEEP